MQQVVIPKDQIWRRRHRRRMLVMEKTFSPFLSLMHYCPITNISHVSNVLERFQRLMKSYANLFFLDKQRV